MKIYTKFCLKCLKKQPHQITAINLKHGAKLSCLICSHVSRYCNTNTLKDYEIIE